MYQWSIGFFFCSCSTMMILDVPLFFFKNLKQSFALEKHGGKKCYMIGARGLSITWGDTPDYWTWKPLPDQSRFVLSLSLSLSHFTDVFTR